VTNGSRRVANITQTTIGDLVTNVSYSFSVAAWNAAGEGDFTSPYAVTTGDAPGAPGNLTVIPGNTNLTASWSPAPPPRVYPILEYALNVTPKNGTPAIYLNVASPARISGLTNGILYLVSVRAYNEVGWGNPSVERGVTPAVPPSPVSNFTAIFASGNDSLLITWSPPQYDGGSALNGYTIHWTSTSGVVGTTFVDSATFELILTGVALGAKYTISITAQNDVGSGLPLSITAPVPSSTSNSMNWAPYAVPIAFVGIMVATFLILLLVGRRLRSRNA
jgi:hypothetical protein